MESRIRVGGLVVGLAAGLLLLGATGAGAATIRRVDCPAVPTANHYASIQAAIDASSTGDTILIYDAADGSCTVPYVEQITVNKNGLNIVAYWNAPIDDSACNGGPASMLVSGNNNRIQGLVFNGSCAEAIQVTGNNNLILTNLVVPTATINNCVGVLVGFQGGKTPATNTILGNIVVGTSGEVAELALGGIQPAATGNCLVDPNDTANPLLDAYAIFPPAGANNAFTNNLSAGAGGSGFAVSASRTTLTGNIALIDRLDGIDIDSMGTALTGIVLDGNVSLGHSFFFPWNHDIEWDPASIGGVTVKPNNIFHDSSVE